MAMFDSYSEKALCAPQFNRFWCSKQKGLLILAGLSAICASMPVILAPVAFYCWLGASPALALLDSLIGPVIATVFWAVSKMFW
jgi:hypothetical protein